MSRLVLPFCKLRLPLGCSTLEPEQLQGPGEFGCRVSGVLRLMTFMEEEKMGCVNQFYYLPMVPYPLDSLPHARDTESEVKSDLGNWSDKCTILTLFAWLWVFFV